LKRLAQGTACEHCLEVFPAKPGPDTVREFEKVYDKPTGPVRMPWRERVTAGCCPMCGSEISTEFFEALHQGVLPDIPDIEEQA
jgi:RNA polymerase subunit RPABC4/transcription elongation factor Spt4